MASTQSQKAWLVAIKRTLTSTHPGLTWDDLADLAGIERRTFKTYRMPEGSSDYRKMPPLAEAAIKALLERSSRPQEPASVEPNDAGSSVLVPALAALVVRQAHVSLIENRMIAGVTREPGMPVGLVAEDRKAMALISRICLTNGLPDYGAEIHEVLWRCTLPLGNWLRIPAILDRGLAATRLIHGEDGIPTAEAEELATGFGGMTASIEDQLFMRFMEVLARFPDGRANQYYTIVREFVVRHPVVSTEVLRGAMDIPAQLWKFLQEQAYEPIPESWELFDDGVQLCIHCGNAMRQGKDGLVCRTAACAASLPAQSKPGPKASELLRVTRGVRQYWVEPGLDEIRLYDALRQMGFPAELYPHRDRVDIAVGELGIDIKAYSSPEILGRRFKRNIGGLAHYPKKWVVVPDRLVEVTPSYLDRLSGAMERGGLVCLTVSQAIVRFEQEVARA